LSDLIQCSQYLEKPLLDWSSEDITDVLIALTQQGKSPRSIARLLSALRSFSSFYENSNYAPTIRLVPTKPQNLGVPCLKIYLKAKWML
jgi:integrase/recombinase XerD